MGVITANADATSDSSKRKQPGIPWLFLVLTVAPALALIVGKWSALPTSDLLTRHVSLLDVPHGSRRTVENIMLVPIGALAVVFVRLTLGIRVLGPFRSFLLAFAFITTGILLGVACFAATVTVLVLVRPLVKSLKLPYFGRTSVMVVAVAIVMLAATVAGNWVQYSSLQDVAFLPVVVVCLVGEAVARTIQSEGVRSAIWRAATTTALAILVAAVGLTRPLTDLLLRYPESSLLAVALIVIVARYGAWRLLENLNPKPRPTPTPASEFPPGSEYPFLRAQARARMADEARVLTPRDIVESVREP